MSLFEQYEAQSMGTTSLPSSTAERQPPFAAGSDSQIASTGFIDTRKGDTTPVFKRKQVDFRPRSKIAQVVVQNNFLGLSYENSNCVLRIDMKSGRQDEIQIGGKRSEDVVVHKIFLDPTGRHLLVSMESQENFYLARDMQKARPLQRGKGVLIESVAWNRSQVDEQSTKEILIGSSKGCIIEAVIEPQEAKFLGQGEVEKYWKQLYYLDEKEAITGLHFELFPYNPTSGDKYFIMATTRRRLYQFTGFSTSAEPPILSGVFLPYEAEPAGFLELPCNPNFSPTGDLTFYYPKGQRCPSKFAWSAGPGVYHGSLDFANPAVATACSLLQYSSRLGDHASGSAPRVIDNAAVGAVLTTFHLLVAYRDRVEGICTLNETAVYSENVNYRHHGLLRGFTVDVSQNEIFLFSDSFVFRYKVNNESRDVWRIYLDKRDFEKARQFAQGNEAHLDLVLTEEAEELFKAKKYDKSAKLFARTQRSFEEVALKFINLSTQEALMSYLYAKMESLKSQDKTQLTMISTWLMEIYLNQLGTLKEEGDRQKSKFDMMRDEFRGFLEDSRVMTLLEENKHVAYELLASHGDEEDLVYFARLMKDYEKVISYYVQQEGYAEALDILARQGNPKLYYKFSPVLIQHEPERTVSAWMKQKGALDPCELIPALVQYGQKGTIDVKDHQGIRYLEYCVEHLKTTEEAIHNYLLSLYAQIQDERPVLSFVKRACETGKKPSFDLKYALRLCAENNHTTACVHLYSAMELYEEAVQLALEIKDVDLARINANKPDESDEPSDEEDGMLKKKLWLMIARHVIEASDKDDVSAARQLLAECELLKIEDVLPFFPNFVTIDDFKDVICLSLQEYNENIETLKTEMQQATESGEQIRKDIQETRKKSRVVAAQKKCEVCSFPLVTREFYVFPCNHVFHVDCLASEVSHHLLPRRRAKLQDLLRQLGLGVPRAPMEMEPVSMAAHYQSLKSDLDELIASECLYCGEMMITTIDQPFVPHNEYDEEIDSWA
ncbi:vacuolar protein sorting-associated protein 18 homolog [Oscarella lobularis]|uniref:vacuolar protein sorting-associated protein 18 homolog n=1 Tax=Oscarella lobularis TaxID=121494 RepID=UPI0033131EE0